MKGTFFILLIGFLMIGCQKDAGFSDSEMAELDSTSDETSIAEIDQFLSSLSASEIESENTCEDSAIVTEIVQKISLAQNMQKLITYGGIPALDFNNDGQLTVVDVVVANLDVLARLQDVLSNPETETSVRDIVDDVALQQMLIDFIVNDYHGMDFNGDGRINVQDLVLISNEIFEDLETLTCL